MDNLARLSIFHFTPILRTITGDWTETKTVNPAFAIIEALHFPSPKYVC
jgi:hypothetical protein